MLGEFFKLALVAILGALLIVALVTDLRSRTISNGLNLTVALMAPLWWACWGLSVWPDVVLQLGIALGVLGLFWIIFEMGGMGGGDVKLLAALALWFPWQGTLAMLILMSLLGAPVTIATVIHHRATRRLGRPEIPYGVAISLAALWLLGERYLNQFA